VRVFQPSRPAGTCQIYQLGSWQWQACVRPAAAGIDCQQKSGNSRTELIVTVVSATKTHGSSGPSPPARAWQFVRARASLSAKGGHSSPAAVILIARRRRGLAADWRLSRSSIASPITNSRLPFHYPTKPLRLSSRPAQAGPRCSAGSLAGSGRSIAYKIPGPDSELTDSDDTAS